MKKVLVFILLAVMLALLVSSVAAQPSTYEAGIQLANLSGSQATVAITFYNPDGSVESVVNDTVAANGSKTYFPIAAVASGFNGSAVVSSDQPVAAIVNVLGDGTAYGASYQSFDQGAGEVSLPLIMKGNFGFDTWFNVQNAGSSSTSVTVAYAGTACSENATLSPGAAATFDQSTNSCLPSGYVGAASVTAAAGGSVVASVLQPGPAQLLAYNGFTGGSTNPVAPLVQSNNFGYFTGIQIQNTGGSATNVTIDYTPGASGSACQETKSVAAGQSSTFGLTGSCIFNQSPAFVGSAEVSTNSAGHDLVGIVNQSNFGDKGAAYGTFDPGEATDSVNFPLIMDKNFGFFTGFSVYNAGNASTTVDCSFSGQPASKNVGGTIAAGEAFSHQQFGYLPAGYVGAANCSASGGGSIVGVANELGSGAGDNFFAYRGFNQ